MARKYNNSKRLESAKNTTEKIIIATEQLLKEKLFKEITLPLIAKRAKVTIQTVMRHMGSRDGCLNKVAEHVANRIDKQRGKAIPNNIDSALNEIIEHYEAESTLILNLLSQSNKEDEFANRMAEKGRNYHRNWVEYCFGGLVKENKEDVIDALVVATDIYVYKLLRLDMKKSKMQTFKILKRIIQGIIQEKK